MILNTQKCRRAFTGSECTEEVCVKLDLYATLSSAKVIAVYVVALARMQARDEDGEHELRPAWRA